MAFDIHRMQIIKSHDHEHSIVRNLFR